VKVHDFEAIRRAKEEKQEEDKLTPSMALKLYLQDTGFIEDADADFVLIVDAKEGSQLFITHNYIADAIVELRKAELKLMQAIMEGAFDAQD